ncbi:MAG: choice-of-anchor D domain-containing protein [Deltaproteobacteria bacterium]|nr:choice-of-anchor D domain-containing protein [Deltaproteobacteria bacterium]
MRTFTFNVGCDEDPTALDDAMTSIQVSLWSLDFGERPLLQSAQGTLTVVNDGDLGVDVSRIRIEGNFASMFLVNYNSLSLETSEQAALVVTFTPAVEGPIDANLILEHEGVLSGFTTVVLQGTGVSSCIADTVVFPDVDRDGYGDRDAEPTNVCEVVAGFSEENTDCDDEVREVNPAATEICDNDIDDDCDDDIDLDDSDCIVVEPEPEPTPLVALVVSPPALNFGGREQNVAHQASLIVVNPNAEEVTVSLAQITGTNADRFTVSSTNFVIDAGGSVNLAVDFTPIGQAEVSAELLLMYTGVGEGSTTIALSGSGLDNCPEGEIEVFVDADLDGYGDVDATVVSSCGLPLGYSLTHDDCDDDDEDSAPDLPEDCSDAANNDCDEYVLDDDDPDCVPGSLIVSPPALDFGARERDVAHQASVTVVNPNGQEVVVSLLQITGTDAGRFSVNLPNFALPASGSVNLSVTFAPTNLAAASAELLLIHTGIGAGSTTLSLSGSGQDPCPQGESTVYLDNDDDGSGDINASGMTSCSQRIFPHSKRL